MGSGKIACITLDIEADLRDERRRVRLFENDNLMNRYATIVKKRHDVKVTGYLVTSLVEIYGPEIHRFANRMPIEFGVHSHCHDQRNPCTEAEVDQAFHTHKAFWGTVPLGYRAPNGLIDSAGINILMDYGFRYDATIFPSIRFDEYSYSNFNLPYSPFWFRSGQRRIMELPYGCLRTIRLVFSLSYTKLLGLGVYKTLMRFFPLPDIVILDTHPYDFYIPLIADNIKGWKRYAHLRNAEGAFDLFEKIIRMLKEQGYEFWYMSELYHYARTLPDIPQVSVEEWH